MFALLEDGSSSALYFARSDEVHRCQGELEQEGEEFMEACAWPNVGCQEIDIQGKPYNLCCCNDRHW